MPNWCENVLTFEGSSADVYRFVLKAKGINPQYLCNTTQQYMWSAVPDEEIKSLVRTFNPDFGSSTDFSFHNFVPVPVEVQRAPYDSNSAKVVAAAFDDPDYVSPEGGYSWQTKNWGTKWGVDLAHAVSYVGEEPTPEYLSSTKGPITSVKFYFDSAWGPPVPVVRAISEAFPDAGVTLEYEERGMWFAGRMIMESGEIIEDVSFEPEPHEDEDEVESEDNRI